MPYFLEVPLADGEKMLVEVSDEAEELVPASRAGDMVGKLPEAFTAGLDRAKSFSTEVLSRMRAGAHPPDTVSVEFGLKLTARAGVVVAQSAVEAHMRVTVEWHRPAAAADGSTAPLPPAA